MGVPKEVAGGAGRDVFGGLVWGVVVAQDLFVNAQGETEFIVGLDPECPYFGFIRPEHFLSPFKEVSEVLNFQSIFTRVRANQTIWPRTWMSLRSAS